MNQKDNIIRAQHLEIEKLRKEIVELKAKLEAQVQIVKPDEELLIKAYQRGAADAKLSIGEVITRPIHA